MLTETRESMITKEDIIQLIAEIDEGWQELNHILLSCLNIRMDLVSISQFLEEKPSY